MVLIIAVGGRECGELNNARSTGVTLKGKELRHWQFYRKYAPLTLLMPCKLAGFEKIIEWRAVWSGFLICFSGPENNWGGSLFGPQFPLISFLILPIKFLAGEAGYLKLKGFSEILQVNF